MKFMKQEKQQEIALMRYGAIAPIIAGLDERYPNKTAFYTEMCIRDSPKAVTAYIPPSH